jgi:hypothetical protein
VRNGLRLLICILGRSEIPHLPLAPDPGCTDDAPDDRFHLVTFILRYTVRHSGNINRDRYCFAGRFRAPLRNQGSTVNASLSQYTGLKPLLPPFPLHQVMSNLMDNDYVRNCTYSAHRP